MAKITPLLYDGSTFHGLRVANVSRCQLWHPGFPSDNWTIADWSNALCGEAGELANVVKKIRRIETGTVSGPTPEHGTLVSMAGKELADVVTYADLLAFRLGLSLQDEIIHKFNSVSMREGFPHRLA